jgi:predicted metal-dependent phosphoesterase TrpH
MIIDLHNHTTKYSPCSLISPDRLIEIYIKFGIEGICITEHNILWEQDEQNELINRYKGLIKIFFGIEVNTDLGHVLVFGSNIKKFPDQIEFDRFRSMIDPNETVLIWAHPFRWEFYKKINLNETLFNNFTAVEYFNGNLTESELRLTENLLSPYQLKLTGGSDTHSIDMAVNFGTQFKNQINSLDELIYNLRYENYFPVKLK